MLFFLDYCFDGLLYEFYVLGRPYDDLPLVVIARKDAGDVHLTHR